MAVWKYFLKVKINAPHSRGKNLDFLVSSSCLNQQLVFKIPFLKYSNSIFQLFFFFCVCECIALKVSCTAGHVCLHNPILNIVAADNLDFPWVEFFSL